MKRLGVVFSVWLLLAASPAVGVIPSPDRILRAAAETNRLAGRASPLLVQVELLRGEPVGEGELLADPSGVARLELRSRAGLVERHLLLGYDYRASRNGLPLERPKPFLPPLALLQSRSEAGLSGALRRLGIATEAVALGRVDEYDCYVIGGRAPGPDRGEPPLRSALWLDQESLEPVRIDRSDGVRYRLGPSRVFGEVRLPAWIEVWLDGVADLRLVVRGATAAAPAASAFDPAWLAEPVGGAPSPAPAAPAAQRSGTH